MWYSWWNLTAGAETTLAIRLEVGVCCLDRVEVRRGSLAGVVGCGRTNAVAFSDVWLGVVQGRQYQNSAAEVVGFYCHHAVYHDPQVDGSFLHFSDVVDAVRGLAVVPTME